MPTLRDPRTGKLIRNTVLNKIKRWCNLFILKLEGWLK